MSTETKNTKPKTQEELLREQKQKCLTELDTITLAVENGFTLFRKKQFHMVAIEAQAFVDQNELESKKSKK